MRLGRPLALGGAISSLLIAPIGCGGRLSTNPSPDALVVTPDVLASTDAADVPDAPWVDDALSETDSAPSGADAIETGAEVGEIGPDAEGGPPPLEPFVVIPMVLDIGLSPQADPLPVPLTIGWTNCDACGTVTATDAYARLPFPIPAATCSTLRVAGPGLVTVLFGPTYYNSLAPSLTAPCFEPATTNTLPDLRTDTGAILEVILGPTSCRHDGIVISVVGHPEAKVHYLSAAAPHAIDLTATSTSTFGEALITGLLPGAYQVSASLPECAVVVPKDCGFSRLVEAGAITVDEKFVR